MVQVDASVTVKVRSMAEKCMFSENIGPREDSGFNLE